MVIEIGVNSAGCSRVTKKTLLCQPILRFGRDETEKCDESDDNETTSTVPKAGSFPSLTFLSEMTLWMKLQL